MDADKKREGFVQRVGFGIVEGCIGVPVGKGAAAFVEVAGFFAEAYKLFIGV